MVITINGMLNIRPNTKKKTVELVFWLWMKGITSSDPSVSTFITLTASSFWMQMVLLNVLNAELLSESEPDYYYFLFDLLLFFLFNLHH